MAKKPKYLIFHTNDEQFAIRIDNIITIEKVELDTQSNQDKRIKRVNFYPNYIKGVFPYKSDVLPIVDFELLNNNNPISSHDENKIILLNSGKNKFGLLVNDVSTITEFDEQKFTQIFSEYPIYTVEKKGEIFLVLDIKKLIDVKELALAFEKLTEKNQKGPRE